MKMTMPNSSRALTLYYAVLQGAHLLVLGYGWRIYRLTGGIGFPAPPPLEGWSEQALHFMLGNGAFDAIVACTALFFVFGSLRGHPWSLPLGLVCVTASLASGVFFAVGTALSGAWRLHPLNYLGLVVVFSPVAFLFFELFRRAITSAGMSRSG